MTMQISSIAFENGGPIPVGYTAEGKNVSPPLHITAVPPGAKTLALIVEDPDAPDPKAPKRTFTHWVVYNLPANTTDLPERADEASIHSGGIFGVNDFKKQAYAGPNPPIGRHRYFFKLFALDAKLPKLEP